jgi:hypothetical protein
LQQFLDSVEARYGLGNEAIEIALWHVNEQHAKETVGQVVIIGDRPPNTRGEVTARRDLQPWDGTPFARPTYFEDEFERIVQNEIKVHAFYLNSDCQLAFEAMARESGGESNYLDVNSPTAGEELTDLVTRHILMQQGGTAKGTTAFVAA